MFWTELYSFKISCPFPKGQGSESFQVNEYMDCEENGMPGEVMGALHPFPILFPYVSLPSGLPSYILL